MKISSSLFSLLRLVVNPCAFLAVGLSAFAAGGAQAQGVGDFIVGGQVVGDDDKYPFIVSIQLDSFGSGQFTHACGGSLVSDRWIVTAAHCVRSPTFDRLFSPSNVGIRIGSNNLFDSRGTFIIAEEIISHPDYNPQTVQNDIALIKLSEPFTASLAVLPANDSPVPLVGESSVAIGWGAVTENGPGSSNLREVGLPVISNGACFPFYPDLFDSRLAFCAGGSRAGGQDSCTGDSGGPLLVVRENNYILSGIISFGAGCARRGVPGVYTRVEAYTDWITSITSGTLIYGQQLSGQPVDNTVITRINTDTSTVGEILSGEVAYFDVSGAEQVNLTSISGDADLFIISDADFQDISPDLIKCRSENPTREDSCIVNEESAFAIVFGFTDTEFSISTESTASGVNTVRPFTGPTVFLDDDNGGSSSSGGSSGLGGLSFWFMLAAPLLMRRRKVVALQQP